MFNDFNSDITGFESVPETERSVCERSSQTTDIKISNQETQTAVTHSSTSQAAPADILNVTQNLSYDSDKLLSFLNRILPQLEEELKNYDSSNELKFSETETEFVSEEQGKFKEALKETKLQPLFSKEKVISCLSWNSSEVMLAVACCEKNHNGWCSHETSVGLYNTENPHFGKDPPTRLLKTSCCVRCVKFHSHNLSLLAGGLYNGEVIVWDLQQDEEVLTIGKKGSGDETAHVDVITFLKWREDENGSWLITAGRDGRIILWKVSLANLSYEINQRFLILKQHLIATSAPNEHLNILHMDFQLSNSSHFVAACDGGIIFYCSTTTAKPLTSFPQFKDPVLLSYKPRKGILTHVSCSSNLFASCGTDSEIHIFKYEQESPMLKIHTNYVLLGVQWNSPKELISWGHSVVESHRIQESSMKNLVCEVEGGILTVAFNASGIRKSRKIAIGNERGEVFVFKDWISA